MVVLSTVTHLHLTDTRTLKIALAQALHIANPKRADGPSSSYLACSVTVLIMRLAIDDALVDWKNAVR